jgi:hypothetical protein
VKVDEAVDGEARGFGSGGEVEQLHARAVLLGEEIQEGLLERVAGLCEELVGELEREGLAVDARSPRVPPTRQSPARLSTTGGPRPSSSHLPFSIGERRAPHPAPGSAV